MGERADYSDFTYKHKTSSFLSIAVRMSLPLQTQELTMYLGAVSLAVEHGTYDDAAKFETLTLFSNWVQGAYGSGPDTDLFVFCPGTTNKTVTLQDNHTRVLNFFTELAESRGVLVFEAALEYTREGLAMNLAPFVPTKETVGPGGESAYYVFDKDTMHTERYELKNVHDPRGRPICAASTAEKAAVFPPNPFTSRPPNCTSSYQILQGDPYRRFIEQMFILRAVVLIPRDRVRRALCFEKEIMDAKSNLEMMESLAPDGPEWKLPLHLKDFPIEADYVHLLEILDISVTWRKFKAWEEVMETLRRFKTVNEIGMSRIFAAIRQFSFKRVQPWLGILITQLKTVDDVSSFIAGIRDSSEQGQHEVHRWCANQRDNRIMEILASEETLQSFVQYGLARDLGLLCRMVESFSKDKTLGFTFWTSLVSHLGRQWGPTKDPRHGLHFMVDCCIAAMTPLVREGAIRTLAPPDSVDDVRRNSEARIERTVALVGICLQFSSPRCGDVLSDILLVRGDVETEFDLFLRPLVRKLRPLLDHHALTNFQPLFLKFYRYLVGMYLGFCLKDESKRGGETPGKKICTKKVTCDHCNFIKEFLYSGDESREFTISNREWKHLQYVFPKLKDKISPSIAPVEGLSKKIRIERRHQPRVEAAKEFLRVIGNEKEISKLMKPYDKEVWKAVNSGEPFNFDLCLEVPPPPVGS